MGGNKLFGDDEDVAPCLGSLKVNEDFAKRFEVGQPCHDISFHRDFFHPRFLTYSNCLQYYSTIRNARSFIVSRKSTPKLPPAWRPRRLLKAIQNPLQMKKRYEIDMEYYISQQTTRSRYFYMDITFEMSANLLFPGFPSPPPVDKFVGHRIHIQ